MKHNFQIEIDKPFWNLHLWNKLFEAYQKDQLDSYIQKSFKQHRFLFKKICQLFTLFKTFIRSNAKNYNFDPDIVDTFRFWFDPITKSIFFGPGTRDGKIKMKRIEYGVPGEQIATHVFSKLVNAFYIYLQDQNLL
jgi:hypothetical protein